MSDGVIITFIICFTLVGLALIGGFKRWIMTNVFYFSEINSVGGVESWLWYLSKKYDFQVYYRKANSEQIKRLAQIKQGLLAS